METSMLRQRAKVNWLKYGDQCSSTFFRKINARRASQRVYQITNMAGETLTDANQVAAEFIMFFQTLLGGERRARMLNCDFLQPHLKHTITMDEAADLVRPVTQAEIRTAFFDISEDSAPGPDGYTSGFFKAAWPEIGADLCAAVAEFFTSGQLLKQLNATLLVLIPKVQLPVRVSEFRPIACCNVVYKAIAKILVGYATGARGLRQGDPMSPYLFVLVMELFHALLKFRIRTDGRFQHHWKCHVESVRSIKNILAEFEDMSGLKVNPNKSSIILSKAVRSERQEILEVLGFQEGSLPIKYLGVPLTASRLTIADCQPLLDKVSSRISGWSHLSLSFAGRVQVIKSVLSALHMYWGSVFILPKAVIKVLERRMTDFLWKGPSGAGYTKVAWVQCCKPKEEGGLGIRSVQYINQALILKQIWRILQQEPRSIWVAWVLRYRLRNQTVWTFSSASAPWFWRKMLKLCPRLKEGLEYRVGDGRKFRLWSDIWHPRGPLLFTFPRGPCITGLPADSMLHQVIHQDQWHWPAAADFDIQEIVAGLPSIYSQQPDEIKWKSNSGMCTTSAILSLLQPSSPHVEWHHLLRGKFKIPRHFYFVAGFSGAFIHDG
ncbi:UNVERIFIED_CONTAM: putative ribonuclease H protein [Sesamum radiatum]|uniref:Ribonuclease H protein n=1 Tax=Sesamum radiatum TaxID=300843 RepID=A0AAW2IT40_SESRA